MKKSIFYILILVSLASCTKKIKVDLLVLNATVYTVNSNFDKAEAFAINKGKFIKVGTNKYILNHFIGKNVIDAKGKTILPGLFDAHCHFFYYGLQQQKVDLRGTTSYEDVLNKIVAFQNKNHVAFITGRGWDQNDWAIKKFPTKHKLDSLFPTTPVAVGRIDGHAILVNQAALNLAHITTKTKVEGGEIIKKNGKITGVLVDNAMNFVFHIIPKPTKKEEIKALEVAQQSCFKLGLTTIDDAGLEKSTIDLIDSLQQVGILKMRIYAMISATPKNLKYYLKKGIYKTDRLDVRSFKYYGDGALGSRGACLLKPYSDETGHFGALIHPISQLNKTAKEIANSAFQLNTHAIGDSANRVVLKEYTNVLKNKKDRRWRIEHAQIIAPQDFKFFKNVFPSIQPTHATSDMYWAENRLGSERMKAAYAYKNLLNQYGMVALGTDFPVEKINPMLTFYAAVARQDVKGYPKNGFQIKNALTRKETLKGMTIWAAYANFEENEKGSIEKEKFADFVILNQDIMKIDIHKVPNTKVISTFLNGEKVY